MIHLPLPLIDVGNETKQDEREPVYRGGPVMNKLKGLPAAAAPLAAPVCTA